MILKMYTYIKPFREGGTTMKNKDKKMVAKALATVANNMLCVAANSRCMLIYHQPKQPERLKKFRKF